ncbi:MAG: nickel-dependent lactate racemase [Anaerolineae bacterium]|nr:nickel-dependent lactate racemase [Anaerolineae bacterium]
MPDFRLPYGKTHLEFSLPDAWAPELIAPRDVPGAADPLAEVMHALEASPVIGRPSSVVRLPSSVAIAVNDKTRPVPHHLLLPPLLRKLEAAGIAPERITLIIATGTHAPMPPEEFGLVIPAEILQRYAVISHDCDAADLVPLGKTQRGVEVRANRRYMAADLRIVVGNIEPHQFMGWSGGVKSAAVGLTARETINANHALMTEPGAELGHYDDNPARQEVEEIGRLMDIGYALNAILNEHKQIVHALAGDPVAVMRDGIPLARGICQMEVAAPFDLLIISPGGHPKDINLYQAQKALGHATLVMQPGGSVILAAACPDGTGSPGYDRFMADPAMVSYEAVLARYKREGYRLGPHKAWQIARDASRIRLLTITDIPTEHARRLLLNPVAGIDEALAAARAGLPRQPHVGIMPIANATIPALRS